MRLQLLLLQLVKQPRRVAQQPEALPPSTLVCVINSSSMTATSMLRKATAPASAERTMSARFAAIGGAAPRAPGRGRYFWTVHENLIAQVFAVIIFREPHVLLFGKRNRAFPLPHCFRHEKRTSRKADAGGSAYRFLLASGKEQR